MLFVQVQPNERCAQRTRANAVALRGCVKRDSETCDERGGGDIHPHENILHLWLLG